MSGYGFFNWRNYYGNRYANNGFRNYNYGRRNYSYNTSNTRNYINSRSINSSNRRVNFTNGKSKRTANNINVDKLASRLKLDKSKVKVYNNAKEFTAGMKKTRNIGRKNSLFALTVQPKDQAINLNPQGVKVIILQELEVITHREVLN
jgi:hypothetical protein